MKSSLHIGVLLSVLAGAPAGLAAQAGLPTTQPKSLTIFREFVKPGHNAEHERLETGWPAAYAKAKSPAYSLALTSLTGPNEVWYLGTYDSWKALGDQFKWESSNPTLSAELNRLSRSDGEHLTGTSAIHTVGRDDLSAGTFPEIAKARVFEITWYRVRLGHETEFESAAKAVKAAFRRALPQASYRMYQVVGGVVGPQFLVFSSGPSFDFFDGGMANGRALDAAYTAEDRALLQKVTTDGLINSERQRFMVNGPMSYVPAETIAQDPGFWRPKKAAVKATP